LRDIRMDEVILLKLILDKYVCEEVKRIELPRDFGIMVTNLFHNCMILSGCDLLRSKY
jgi:hypothetical protein